MLRARSIPIVHVRGCDVRLDPALILALFYAAWVLAGRYEVVDELEALAGLRPLLPSTGWAFVVLVGLLVGLLLHEAAHLAVARTYGAHPRQLILSPLGARWEGARGDGRGEWRSALAGPLLSISIGAALLTIFDDLGLERADVELAMNDLGMFQIAFGLVNLLPVFPLDGGRIVHGLVRRRLGVPLAGRIPIWIGRGLAILCVVWAIAFRLVPLFFVAVYLWSGTGPRQRAP